MPHRRKPLLFGQLRNAEFCSQGTAPVLNWSSSPAEAEALAFVTPGSQASERLWGRLELGPNLESLTAPRWEVERPGGGAGLVRNYRAPAVFQQTPPPFSPKLGAA